MQHIEGLENTTRKMGLSSHIGPWIENLNLAELTYRGPQLVAG